MDKKQFLVLLGKHIVKLRQQKGWTQSELSRNCDKDRQSIERLEKGKINPSAYYLYQIAEGLGIKFEDLLEAIRKLNNSK
jgi:transcriptional regulator with XRE-family HTH domain